MDEKLLGQFDRDPGRWRPLFYSVTASVPVIAGTRATVSVNLNNQPFILKRIQTAILGNTNLDSTGLFQDGQYLMEFKDEQSVYQNGSLLAAAWLGTAAGGYALDLPFPIPYAGNKTLTFSVASTYTRALTPQADYFDVQIQLHGVSDWGIVQKRRA